jgi:hypothetical protein
MTQSATRRRDSAADCTCGSGPRQSPSRNPRCGKHRRSSLPGNPRLGTQLVDNLNGNEPNRHRGPKPGTPGMRSRECATKTGSPCPTSAARASSPQRLSPRRWAPTRRPPVSVSSGRSATNADPGFPADPDTFPPDAMGDDGRSAGPFQQQGSGPGDARPWCCGDQTAVP